jgi:hypothetical protein
MSLSRIGLAAIGGFVAYFAIGGLAFGQAVAYFVEWTVTGLVIGLIYRPPAPH